MRLPIHLQREIARLHYYDTSQSNRAIGRALGVSANTVRSMRHVLESHRAPVADLLSLDDDAWCALLGTGDKTVAQRKEAPDWTWVHAEMQRPDATLEQLWREWRAQCPTGIGYSQFTEGYRRWAKHLHVVMRRTHRPGGPAAPPPASIRGAHGTTSARMKPFARSVWISPAASTDRSPWRSVHARTSSGPTVKNEM